MKSGFSLEELGFLLGLKSGSAAGKHERFRRTPSVSAVFAYEVVFGAPASELFRGHFAGIEREVVRRALELEKRVGTGRLDPRRTRLKRDALRSIYLPFTDNPHDPLDS